MLEGDAPEPFLPGLGPKYVLGPAAPASQPGSEAAQLPDAYGTGKLTLAARDPHWLYAHWDLTLPQQRRYNALSADRHLVVRIHPGTIGAAPPKEVHVHPESRHWFLHVEGAGAQYVAELGYYKSKHQWVTLATSTPATTPPDAVSDDQTVRFATVPAHVRLRRLGALAQKAVPDGLPPRAAARERALAELAGLHLLRQDWGSSAEIAERVRPGGEQEVLSVPLAGEAGSVSSPLGAAEQPSPEFWFNINAELVLYGATEPNASVTVAGRPIPLRPDGSCSCRFALPDGDHTLTLSAKSAQGDLRQAELKISRRTDCRGEVGLAPQAPSLQAPVPESL